MKSGGANVNGDLFKSESKDRGVNPSYGSAGGNEERLWAAIGFPQSLVPDGSDGSGNALPERRWPKRNEAVALDRPRMQNGSAMRPIPNNGLDENDDRR